MTMSKEREGESPPRERGISYVQPLHNSNDPEPVNMGDGIAGVYPTRPNPQPSSSARWADGAWDSGLNGERRESGIGEWRPALHTDSDTVSTVFPLHHASYELGRWGATTSCPCRHP